MRSRFNNPVLQKEFKLRFRSIKSFLGIFFYLLILGTLALVFIHVSSEAQHHLYFRPEVSRGMFSFLSIIQLLMLLFITPGLTAGVISGERERQTLNILLTTTVSSFSIITGKMVSAISYLLLLLVASLPLYSFVFLFGGVAPGEVVLVFLIYVTTIFSIGSVGVLVSTLIRKTIASVITSYAITLFLTIGTIIIFFISMGTGLFNPSSNHALPYIVASFNPIIALYSILESDFLFYAGTNSWFNFPIWIPFLCIYLFILIVNTAVSTWKLRRGK